MLLLLSDFATAWIHIAFRFEPFISEHLLEAAIDPDLSVTLSESFEPRISEDLFEAVVHRLASVSECFGERKRVAGDGFRNCRIADVMLRGLLLLALCGLVAVVGQASRSERVLLRDVQTLTLHQGKWTTGKRTRPVPQLTCIGGTNRCKHLPATVQCYNRGSDGQDVQWECKAVMDKNLRFNKIEVTCEGYDYPEDDYVLVGSCGLEYSIDTIDGKTPFPEPHFNKPDPRSVPHKPSRRDDPGLGTLITLAIIASLMYLIYNHCVRSKPSSRSSAAPPPPGFRPDFVPTGPSPPYPQPQPSAPPSDEPGFWSGLGLGGLGGYFFGSRRRAASDVRTGTSYFDGETVRQPSYERRNESGGWSSGRFGDTRRRTTETTATGKAGDSSESSVATGFGGTKRR